MDQMTQQNAALVEQAAAAAESMRTQAGALAQAVAVFKLQAAANMSRVAAPKKAVAAVAAAPVRAAVQVRSPRTEVAPRAAARSKSGIPIGATDDWEEF